jgi:penicillin-binding protein 1A
MGRRVSEGRAEPNFFGRGQNDERGTAIRGERLDFESEEPQTKRQSRAKAAKPSPSRIERARAPAKAARSRPRGTNAGGFRRFLPSRLIPSGFLPSGPRGGGWRPLLFWGLRWGLIFGIWALVALLGLVAVYSIDLPNVNSLDTLTRKPSVTFLGTDGQSFASFGDLYAEVVPLNEMPRYLPQAVLATEDRRFYDHFGIDPIGLGRAVLADLRLRKIREGGSTITQQLAKNLFLSNERTVKRKVQELLLALWLEHKFSKEQILTIYLNRVYLGAGTYGVEAAAEKYFGKSARHVSLYEAAVLAGLLKAPSRFNPAANPDLTKDRAAQVLANMMDAGYITEPQSRTALAQASAALRPSAAAARGRYFADWAMDQVKELVGYIDSDLVVRTTFDPRVQRLAEEAVTAILDKDGAKFDTSQGALVALSPDGAVKALVGGRDYRESQFDRATQAQRQPGSSFKPFVYLAGLEAGFTPDNVFNDAPIAYGKWHPSNYEDKYFGDVSLREALAHSLNSVAIQLAERAGVDRVIAAAHRLGITSDLRRDASIALGTSEVNLLELTAAYGAFDNGGTAVWPYGITEIRDRSGKVLYQRSGSGPSRVMTEEQAATMVSMMTGVIDHGTGRAATIGRPAAGKTGTTQDYKDAWFVGFTPDLICGVWVGNDDGTPMKKVTGGKLPAQVWHNFMIAALAGIPPRDFASPPPSSLIDSVIQSLTGSGSSSESNALSGTVTPVTGPGTTVTPIGHLPTETQSGAVRAGRL